MRISVWPSYERSWQETLDVAHFAEAHGLDGFWYADHLMPHRPDDAVHDGDALECWTVLSAIGALVPRVRLVSMVSPVTIHHPVLLAKKAVTTDHVSGGRAVLGMGAGWQVNEHTAYHFELPAPGPRVSRFEEAIQLVRQLTSQRRTTFHGAHYAVDDAPFAPKPVGRLPILVGTGSPRMLRITARHADEWNTWGDPTEVRRRTDLFLAACDTVGRDPSTVRRSAQALVFLTDGSTTPPDPSLAMPGRSLVGGPDQLVEMLGQYRDMGVDEFAVPDFTLGATPVQRADTLAALHDQVLRHFL